MAGDPSGYQRSVQVSAGEGLSYNGALDGDTLKEKYVFLLVVVLIRYLGTRSDQLFCFASPVESS